MARQTIDLGTSPNRGDGDPLRTAFDKVNDNFAELYAGNFAEPSATGSSLIPDTDATYDLGSADKQWADLYVKDFIYLNGARLETDANGNLRLNGAVIAADSQGSVFGDDSTLLVDGVNNAINLDGTVSGDIIPDTDVAYDLGSASKRFRDIYLSGSTIDLGGTTLSIVGGELQLGGIKVPTTADVAASIASAVSAPTGDLTGSVFADDSTLLVDGVNGVIPTSVLQGDISNDIKSSDIVIETTTSPGSISLTQTGIGNISISGTAIDFNNSPIQNFILSTLSSGLTAPGSAVVAGETAINFNFSGVGTKLTVEQDAITIGSGVTVSGFVGDITGDLTGSVFADDSTTVVDGVNANVTANILTSNTASNFNGTLSVVGVTRLYDDLIIDGGDIVSDNSAYFFGNLECSNITNLQNNEFASDNLTLSAEGSIVLNGNVFLGTVAGQSDFYGNIEFNDGTTAFQSGNSVDFNCPVDFTNATVTLPQFISLATLKAEVAASTDFADFQTRIAAL